MAKVHFNLPRKLSGSTLKNGRVNYSDKITEGNSAFNSLPSDFSAGSQVRQTRQYRAAQGRKGFDRDAANKAQNDYFDLKEQRAGRQAAVPKTSRQQKIGTKSEESQRRVRQQRKIDDSRHIDREASQKAQNEYFDLKEARAANKERVPKTQRQKDIKRLSRKNRKAREARIEKENQFDGQAANRSQKDYQNLRKEREARQADTPLTPRQQRINELKEANAGRRQTEQNAREAQVNRYKDQINKSRAETAETARLAAGGGRYGTGLDEATQASMYGEDMGRRFKANGGWGGVGRGAVQGAAIGGLAGGTVESMQGGDFWDGAKSGAMMGATGMAGLRAAKQATGAEKFFRGPNNIASTYGRQKEQYGVGVKALMLNSEMAGKAKSVMNWRKDRQ